MTDQTPAPDSPKPEKEKDAQQEAIEKWIDEHTGATFLIAGVIVVALIIGGVMLVRSFLEYSEESDQRIAADKQTSSTPEPTKAADPYADIRDEKGFVSKKGFDAAWPLTVDAGVLKCEKDNAGGVDLELVTFTDPKGTEYALNGSAKSHTDAKAIDPIWADEPDAEGIKINIGPLIDAGRDLC